MTTLLLIRHGQSEANKLGVFAGHFDAPLLPLGVEQAKKTGEFIAANYQVDKVYASDLKRAYVTGSCIAECCNASIVAERNLREISAGKWEACAFDDLVELYADDYDVWLQDIGNARCTGGESVAELGERVLQALTTIAKVNDCKTVAIATHATPIRAMQSYVQYGGFGAMKDIPWVTNASVSVLSFDDGKWSFLALGIDSHLGEIKSSLPTNV